jgi:flagellar basal body-associated protein FliL
VLSEEAQRAYEAAPELGIGLTVQCLPQVIIIITIVVVVVLFVVVVIIIITSSSSSSPPSLPHYDPEKRHRTAGTI